MVYDTHGVIAMFKVGDAVRVKAGSPAHPNVNIGWRSSPYAQTFGKKLVVDGYFDTEVIQVVGGAIELEGMDERHLEPWKESEEWNGSKWVPKKKAEEAKPCVVMRRGGIIAFECESMNAAFLKADDLANKEHGAEFAVYQEKGSRKVEKKPSQFDIAVNACMELRSHPIALSSDCDSQTATPISATVMDGGKQIDVSYRLSKVNY